MLHAVGTGASAPETQARLAREMVADGIDTPAIRSFASLGTHGVCSSNIERDLLTWTQGFCKWELDTYDVKLQLLMEDEYLPSEATVPCLLPHEAPPHTS
eukprot:8301455-Pyramimonas_sp.AAC.2